MQKFIWRVILDDWRRKTVNQMYKMHDSIRPKSFGNINLKNKTVSNVKDVLVFTFNRGVFLGVSLQDV